MVVVRFRYALGGREGGGEREGRVLANNNKSYQVLIFLFSSFVVPQQPHTPSTQHA